MSTKTAQGPKSNKDARGGFCCPAERVPDINRAHAQLQANALGPAHPAAVTEAEFPGSGASFFENLH